MAFVTENNTNLCISAYGAVTPLGNNIDEIAENLINEKSGISLIKKFDTINFKCKSAGIPAEYNNNTLWPYQPEEKPYELKYTKDAILQLLNRVDISKHYNANEVGCILGVDQILLDISNCKKISENIKGDMSNVNEDTVLCSAMQHFDLDMYHLNTPSAILKEIYKHTEFSAAGVAVPGVCAASAQSLLLAMEYIQSGKANAMITGGISAKVTPLDVSLFEGMGVISTDERYGIGERSRPFDKERTGFALSEGGILFLIEKEETVLARGDKPLLRICGYGASLSAQNIVAPHTEEKEMKLSMEKALSNARLRRDDIDVISTHGTSTQQNDFHEAMAIEAVFGKNSPHVIATKSYHGHLMAAAGAMEILCIIAFLKRGFIPPVLNLNEIDDKIPSSVKLVTEGFHSSPRYVLKNSFGMGGVAASIVFENVNY